MELSIIVGNTRYITKNIVEVEKRWGRDAGEMEYGGVGIWGKVQELWAASQLDRTRNKPSTPRMPRKASIFGASLHLPSHKGLCSLYLHHNALKLHTIFRLLLPLLQTIKLPAGLTPTSIISILLDTPNHTTIVLLVKSFKTK